MTDSKTYQKITDYGPSIDIYNMFMRKLSLYLFSLVVFLSQILHAREAHAFVYTIEARSINPEGEARIARCLSEEISCLLDVPLKGAGNRGFNEDNHVRLQAWIMDDKVFVVFSLKDKNLWTNSIGKKFFELPIDENTAMQTVKLYSPNPINEHDQKDDLLSSPALRVSSAVVAEMEITIHTRY